MRRREREGEMRKEENITMKRKYVYERKKHIKRETSNFTTIKYKILKAISDGQVKWALEENI